MRPFKLQFTLVFLLIFFCSRLFAATAADIVVQLVQPTGEVINAMPVGDEWNNRMETLPGYTVARDNKGVWRYVTGYGPGKSPVFSQTNANLQAPPGLTKHINAGSSRPQGAPATGPQSPTSSPLNLGPAQSSSSPVLFILVEFSDQLHGTSTGSWGDLVGNKVNDYFYKVSHGNADLNPANETSGTINDGVVGWLNIGSNHPDTAGNTNSVNRDLTEDAIIAADPFVDFSSYDTNGNNFIESNELSVVVIVAGYETSYAGSGTPTPSVWGHKWGWSSNFAPQVDNVKILEYAQFGEFHASSLSNKHQATMGIMVHELGHLAYGLPDLYDIDGGSSGIGAFGLMSSGSWGNSSSDNWAGQTPVSTSAWSKYVLNWVDDIEGVGEVSIGSSGTGSSANTVFSVFTPNSEQYFLVENRQATGYDRGLERWFSSGFSGGLAIWHIDNAKSSNTNNTHRMVDLEEADGSEMGNTRGSNSDFWRIGNGLTFNANSNPSSNLYDGSDSGISITVTSTTGDNITADFGTPPEPLATPAIPSFIGVTNNEDGTATVIWNHDGLDLTKFELQRQKAHKKRANTWTETVGLPDADKASREIIDNSGTGTFRYSIRAMNETVGSNWQYSQSEEITGSGSEPALACPVLDGLPSGDSCSSGDQCCSGNCKGKPGNKTCK